MGVFVRRVKTASGATAVQTVHKRGRRVLSIEHIGSARTDDELAVLLQVAGNAAVPGSWLWISVTSARAERAASGGRGHGLADPVGGPGRHLR
jgi:hypothetical protein